MKRTKTGDPKLAIAYLRVSTDDQRLGPDAQRAAINEWANREGITILAWHLDQGVSGGSELDTRPGLGAALGELKARGAGVLAVAKRDRLARDSGVAIAIERAVKSCGGRVLSAEGTGNGEGATDDFVRRILDAAAEYERALIRARTKAALAVKRANGQRVGSVRYGFRLRADGKSLEPDDAEAAVVAEVRVLRAGRLSMVRIANELTRRGFATRSGGPWNPGQVFRMLATTA